MTTRYTANLHIPYPAFDATPWHVEWWNTLTFLDSLINNALLAVNTSAWANSHVYAPGQGALDAVTGQLYLCVVAHTSAVSPTLFSTDRATHPTYWRAVAVGMSSRGAWAQATSYNLSEFVYDTVQGIVAMCITPHVSTAVGTIRTDAVNWVFLIDATLVLSAAATSFAPAGTIAATTVQAAIAELDSEMNSRISGLVGLIPINFLVNPAMQISQENGNTGVTANLGFPVDQWQIGSSTSGTYTCQQVTGARTISGNDKRIRLTVNTADAAVGAGDYVILYQNLEGQRIAGINLGQASAKTLTFKFGCKGPAGTYSIFARNSAVNRIYVGTFTISGGEAGVDVYKTVEFTGDITGSWAISSALGMQIGICLMVGSTNQVASGSWLASGGYGVAANINIMNTIATTFELFDVGLYPVASTLAPDFTIPDFPTELVKCQRYYENSYPLGSVPGTVTSVGMELQACGTAVALDPIGKSVKFKVSKRTNPTMVIYSSGSGASGKVFDYKASADINASTAFGSSEQGSVVTATPAGTTQTEIGFHWTASARM